jgi:hypothetical protein
MYMPCNESGYTNPELMAKFGVVDFDWSNSKGEWSAATPMDCEERLLIQADMVKKVNPQAKVMVYRNLVKALPWFSSVREKMLDPAFADWFLPFDPNLTKYHTPNCSTDASGTKCSKFYHDLGQTPKPNQTQHNNTVRLCRTGVCDCGEGLPCGEYLWNHRNSSLRKWLVDEFVMNNRTGAGNPNIDGFYLDDQWSVANGPTEEKSTCIEDIGLTSSDMAALTDGWAKTNDAANAAVAAGGGLNYHSFQQDSKKCAVPHNDSSCKDPRATCAAFHRRACSNTSSFQTSYTFQEFTRKSHFDPFPLPYPEQDVASFLLVRGPYSWLGYSWMGCNTERDYQSLRPKEVEVDYGVPVDAHCTERGGGGGGERERNGVFVREWSKATVELDCNIWQATIKMKSPADGPGFG